MKLGEIINESLATTWKLKNELLMYLVRPLVYIYTVLLGVDLKRGYKFYGLPKIFKHRGSIIEIGENFEDRNSWASNPLGINHPTILCTWMKGAEIKIGKDVGISGGSIVAAKKVEIGDGTIIGTNCLIIDSDFHPIKSKTRRYDKKKIRSVPITIGKNVFLGTGCVILKGSKIPDNTVVPAGKVVRSKDYY